MGSAMNDIRMLLTAGVALDVIASLAVVFNRGITHRQRLFQLALVWLVPVLGALACLGVFWSDRAGAMPRNTFDPLYRPGDEHMHGPDDDGHPRA